MVKNVSKDTSMLIIEDSHVMFNEKLDTNILSLTEEITHYCDELIESIRRRKIQLINQAEEIRKNKMYSVQQSDIETKKKTCAINNINNINEINTGCCLRFVQDDSIIQLLNNFGCIDEERACAGKSRVTGLNLEYAIVNEPIRFELETCNKTGELSWIEQDNVIVRLEKDDRFFNCVVQNQCNGIYTIICDLPEIGNYHINIYINGNLLPGCPYTLKSFERKDIKFIESEDTMQLTFNIDEKAAFVEKSESYQIVHLYSDALSPAHAWKVNVTTACPKIKVKFGYAYNMRYIPDLREEFCKKFNFSELLNKTDLAYLPIRRHHTYQNGHRRKERKQSSYQRNTLTFFIVQDANKKLIHIAVEQLRIYHTISYKDEHSLEPFIGIKHFCANSGCPRPMLSLL